MLDKIENVPIDARSNRGPGIAIPAGGAVGGNVPGATECPADIQLSLPAESAVDDSIGAAADQRPGAARPAHDAAVRSRCAGVELAIDDGKGLNSIQDPELHPTAAVPVCDATR